MTSLLNALGSVNDCYLRQVLDGGHIEVLRVPTKNCDDFEELE